MRENISVSTYISFNIFCTLYIFTSFTVHYYNVANKYIFGFCPQFLAQSSKIPWYFWSDRGDHLESLEGVSFLCGGDW